MRKSICLLILGLLVALGLPSFSAAAIITYNGSNQPTLIQNLVISGQAFDVTVQYNTSFNSLFTAGDPPSPVPYFWGNQTGAIDAANAIRDALNAEGPVFPTTQFQANIVGVPYEVGSPADQVRVFDAGTILGGDYAVTGPISLNRDDSNFIRGFATFSSAAAVPEPSSLAILATFTAMLGGVSWLRRRRKQPGRISEDSSITPA